MKIILDKIKCIGCGSCVNLCPQFFEMSEEGKSHLKDSKPDSQTEEKETVELGCAKDAEEACPVQAIKTND